MNGLKGIIVLAVLSVFGLSPCLAFGARIATTGQTKCYHATGSTIDCEGTGQDGDIKAGAAWPDPRFVENGDETITDSLTGLIWTKDANSPGPAVCSPATTKNWQEALDYIKCLNTNNYLGFNDWRLANINELDSLVYVDATHGWLDAQLFGDTVQSNYASSTTYSYNPKVTWLMTLISGDFVLGSIKTFRNDNASTVWPVRGVSNGPARVWRTGQQLCYNSSGKVISCVGTGQDGETRTGTAWPIPRFTASGDCLTDNLTGLMWMKNPDSIRRTWQQALEYANTLTLCGHSDWRMPNLRELRSLVNYGQKDNSVWLNSAGFSNILPHVYWASTSYGMLRFFTYFMDSWSGGTFGLPKHYGFYVLPVRGGLVQPKSLIPTPTASDEIVLSWEYFSDNELGYKLERKRGLCDSTNAWSQVAKPEAGVKNYTNSGLPANTRFSYRVRAYDAAAGSEYSDCATSVTGLAGTPNSPTDLVATSVASSKISLAWKDNSTDNTNFKIYRKKDAGSWTLIKTMTADAVSFSDAGAAGNDSTASYSYYIKACNAEGCSPESNTAVGPYRPTKPVATPSTGKIDVTWQDNSGNETGFEIYRKPGNCSAAGAWSLLNTASPNTEQYSDSAVTTGAAYSYRVRSFHRSPGMPYAYGYSMYTGCVSATAQ